MGGWARSGATWVGVDLADERRGALVIVFERAGTLHAFCRFYLPQDLVEICAHRTTTRYKVWADQGFITTTKGNFIDHNATETGIRALCEVRQVEIIHKKPDTYSEPAKLLEAWVEINKFRFDGNPMLTWMASNASSIVA